MFKSYSLTSITYLIWSQINRLKLFCGGRTCAPPEPPIYMGGLRLPSPPLNDGLTIYWLFNRNPIKKLFNTEARGRLKGGVWPPT